MKFKEELLRILMNAILLLMAGGISILYKEYKIPPSIAAIWAFVFSLLLMIIAWIIAKGIDKK